MSARYLQNSFVPVNRLPPEVLSLIPASLHSKRDLINATAVCRYWRNTLLSSPNLWCDVDCPGSRGPLHEHMFREHLERSREVPLNLRLTSVRYLPDLTPHLARFSALAIELAAPEQVGMIAAYFSHPAPILRRLSISAVPSWDEAGLSIPSDLFGGDFASLRSLRIRGFSTLIMPQHFPHLTRFDFQTYRFTTFETDVMLEVLEHMPSLEVLHVKFCPAHDPPLSSTPILRSVTLPKLKEVELSLEDLDPILPPLLSALTLPSAEKITIDTLPLVGGLVLPSSFKGQLPNFAETPVIDICLGPKIFRILFHGLRGSRLLFTARWITRFRFWRGSFCGTPFHSVRKMAVTVEGLHCELDQYFFDLLQAMERLECLEMRGQCTWVLGLWSAKSPEAQRSICPSLRSLVIVKEINYSVSGPLAELVTARRSHGVPLVEAAEVVSDV
jgi:hypothetical protein